ncbi:hypothetical protein AAULH_03411 [Lactobacillus helveticus MTCC 5463]|nr:hypothetical protein AAULH_03411 [Lactobacillus helveticus MTCC 5463]
MNTFRRGKFHEQKPLIISTDPGIDDIAAMTISFLLKSSMFE